MSVAERADLNGAQAEPNREKKKDRKVTVMRPLLPHPLRTLNEAPPTLLPFRFNQAHVLPWGRLRTQSLPHPARDHEFRQPGRPR